MSTIYEKKPWLAYYPKSVDKEIGPISYQNLVEFYDQACEQFNHRVAFNSLGAEITFAQVQSASKRIAAWLQKQYSVGSKIALISPNALAYPVIVQAIHRAGMVAVNINPLLTARELDEILLDSEVETVFVWDGSAHLLDKVGEKAKKQVKTVVVFKLTHYFPLWKGMMIDIVLKRVKKLIAPYSLQSYQQVLNLSIVDDGEKVQATHCNHQTIAFLQYTGGTTGRSKGVILTHGNLLSNITQATQYLPPGIAQSENVVTALPLYHIFALTANFYIMFGLGIKNVLITNPRDLSTFIKILIKNPPHIMVGVNTLFNALVNHQAIQKVDFSHLKLSLGGGMSVQKDTSEQWLKVTGCFILEAYGLSETSPAVTINPHDTTEFTGSIGLPIPGTEICIVDEREQAVACDEEGELCVRGPQVTQGYWKNKQATQEAFTQQGQWFKTGDIVRMNEKGFVYLLDRKKDMVVVSGFNVYPVEVEQIINQLSGVFECSCVGVSDDKTGEALKAFIIRAENSAITEKDITAHCEQNLTAYKVPKKIEFVSDFPRSNVGKVLRRKLTEK